MARYILTKELILPSARDNTIVPKVKMLEADAPDTLELLINAALTTLRHSTDIEGYAVNDIKYVYERPNAYSAMILYAVIE